MKIQNYIGKVYEISRKNGLLFVSSKYYSDQFVKIEMSHIGNDVFLIGEVISIQAFNPYFDKPNTIRYIEENDESLSAHSLFLSNIRPLAYLQNNIPLNLNFPPSPGSNVYVANNEEIQIALGIESDGIRIGNLSGKNNLDIKISATKLFRTHFSVLGRTGTGKSYFTKGLVKNLSNEYQFLIFSSSDEYNALVEEIPCKVYQSSNLTFPFEPSYLTMIYGMTLREQLIIEKFYKNLNEKSETISSMEIQKKFKDWIQKGESVKHSGNLFPDQLDSSSKDLPPYVDAILSKIKQKEVVFAKHSLKIPFEGSVIVDMSDLSQETQELFITHALNNILQSYKKSPGKKTIIIIEEAHNFAPSVQTTLCKEKIVQIAREGRKLGLSLCLISQRPRHIDQTILSQAGTLFIFNIPHPDDVQHVLGISPIYNQEMPDEVRKLNTGECLIIGDASKHPIICNVNFN
ncbi:MAG: ATP-binding protein [Ignavibacteriaceae bacterium]